MPQLDSRQAELILILLKHDRPLSADKLGKELGITARMVRYNLQFAQSWLAERGVELTLRTRTGIGIRAPETVRRKLAAELQKENISFLFPPEDRLRVLLFELLSCSGYLTDPDLEERLSISRTTLSRDLNLAEKSLAECHLYLRRKPRLGLTVIGREDDYRHTLASLILEVCQATNLMDLFCWGKRVQDINGLYPGSAQAYILNRVADWDPPTAWRIMGKVEDQLDLSLVDQDHLSLSLYLCLMVQRYRAGHFIDLSIDKVNEYRHLPEFQLIRRIFDGYASETGLVIIDAEIVQLILETTTSLRQSLFDDPMVDPAFLKQPGISTELIQEFLDIIHNKTGLDLKHPNVIERMVQHLRRSITRLQYGLPITNPLKDKVRTDFPELWDATQEAAKTLEKRLEIILPEEELSYLTMYVGLSFELNRKQREKTRPKVIVVCPSGGVTVWMMVSRLRSEIPDIEVVDVVSLRKLHLIKLEGIDAVISTAAFTVRSLPVITVSPLIDENEVELIRQKLNLN